MKQDRCILVIDDKSQSAVIKGIKSRLSNDFVLDFIDIRTGSASLKQDGSEDLDVEKLKTEIKTRINHKHIDIALTDFDLECDYLTGLDIVHMVHGIRDNIDFFIYSGNWEKVIEYVVGKDYPKASSEKLVNGINKLIKAKIVNCVGRVDYQDTLIEYLKNTCKFSVEQRLSTLLRTHGEMKFDSCFPEFKGLSFSEIADRIENRSDARSNEWIEAVLTQTIAYLVKVNE